MTSTFTGMLEHAKILEAAAEPEAAPTEHDTRMSGRSKWALCIERIDLN